MTLIASAVDASELFASATGLPPGLALSYGTCTALSARVTCSWVIDGQVLDTVGTFLITVTESDGELESQASTALVVEPEDARLAFDEDNPVAVRVAEPGGSGGAFSLSVVVVESLPDLSGGAPALPGDIGLAQVSMSLVPVGPGGTILGACTPGTVSGSGYDAVLPVACAFNDVPVNTYSVQVSLGGGFYDGYAEDVLTVYDPSLGFASGGGWFY